MPFGGRALLRVIIYHGQDSLCFGHITCASLICLFVGANGEGKKKIAPPASSTTGFFCSLYFFNAEVFRQQLRMSQPETDDCVTRVKIPFLAPEIYRERSHRQNVKAAPAAGSCRGLKKERRKSARTHSSSSAVQSTGLSALSTTAVSEIPADITAPQRVLSETLRDDDATRVHI